MPVRDCFKKYKLGQDKLTQFEKLVSGGMNEFAAAREVIISEYDGLHNQMNNIRKALGVKEVKLQTHEDISPKIKEINDKYDKIEQENIAENERKQAEEKRKAD